MNRLSFLYLMLAVGVFCLSGCMSMVRGSTQQIAINTLPGDAKVNLSNGVECVSPCLLTVKRSEALKVTASKQGCEPQTTSMVPTQNSGTIAFGGPIDYGTGAVYDLQPNPLTINLVCNK